MSWLRNQRSGFLRIELGNIDSQYFRVMGYITEIIPWTYDLLCPVLEFVYSNAGFVNSMPDLWFWSGIH